MHNDYFEADIGLHPCVVMSPTHDGSAFCLLTQGPRDGIAYQLTAYREAFRALLQKQGVFRPLAASTQTGALPLVSFRVGVYLVIVPAGETDVSGFMARVQIVGRADAFDAAARMAASTGSTALVCEVIGLVDGLGPIDTVAWARAPH